MRKRWPLNDNWYFAPGFTEEMAHGNPDCLESCEQVRLPHSVKETPFNYFSVHAYEGTWSYGRKLDIPEMPASYHLKFHGAAHAARVYLDGELIGGHIGGYTAFELELEHVVPGKSYWLCVELDTHESLNCPPFGHVIDYMTYGGLYREVELIARPKYGIDHFKIWGEDLLSESPKIEITFSHKLNNFEVSKEMKWQLELMPLESGDDALIWEFTPQPPDQENTYKHSLTLPDKKVLRLWDIEAPYRYRARLSCKIEGSLIDATDFVTGFREAFFKNEGFYLNGRRVQLRGINRHQSYPYVGYAMPKGPQWQDAHIIKHELGMNAVRTAHYPQSHHFIEACDAMGILVFTEIPGWQHIGDQAWQDHALHQVEEMILQYQHHPAIILWGVRINESQDNHELYTRTNQLAKRLDPTRQRGGVRYLRNSEFLEDVYTFNDFSYNRAKAKQKGILSPRKVTNQRVPYLVSEYNGHMYPTKSYDPIQRRTEHALRHAHVLSAIHQGQPEGVSGGFAWCFTDYNTHKDFGSGDGICHHGVMDMFRNPKLAAAVYASQKPLEEGLVLSVSSELHIGDYPAGYLEPIYIFTNAPQIKLYKNGAHVGTYDRTNQLVSKAWDFKGLKHAPIVLEDLIGDAMEKGEGYSRGKANRIKKLLLAGAKYGADHLPLSALFIAARLVLFEGFKPSQGMALYGRYVGNWGDQSTTYTFEALQGDRVLGHLQCGGEGIPHLEIDVDRQVLEESDTYDVACIRITSRDDRGNLLPYDGAVVTLRVEGPLELIGPSAIALRGGMGGTYIKSTGKAGQGQVIVQREAGEEITLAFTVKIKGE